MSDKPEHLIWFDDHVDYGRTAAICVCGWRYLHARTKVAERAADRHTNKDGAEPPVQLVRPGVPDREVERFALDADLTVYWPWVRPCWQEPR